MRVFAMELFTKLFGDLLLFVYHCFDRIVINGYRRLWLREPDAKGASGTAAAASIIARLHANAVSCGLSKNPRLSATFARDGTEHTAAPNS